MKKILLMLMFGLSSIYATNGEDIFKEKCVMCHANQGMMSMNAKQQMRLKMQNATQEEKLAMREKMMQKMQNSSMKAPAMPMVSKRLKMKLASREEFIAFVEDYIQNPSKEKGFCMPMAYNRFGTMPPIGKGMTKTERATIAAWLYDNYQDSWGKPMDAKMCEMRNKGMKCGPGKCGSSKCGAVKIPTH